MQKVAVVHGPNINLLGVREPEVYGTTNYGSVQFGIFESLIHFCIIKWLKRSNLN